MSRDTTSHNPLPISDETDIETGRLVKRDLGDSTENEEHPDFLLTNRVRQAEREILILYCGIILLILSVVFLNSYDYYLDHKYDYLLKTQEEFLAEMTNETHRRNLMIRHSYRHRKTCNDHRYGCCEIHTECHISQENVVYSTTKELSLDNIVKHDAQGTNCHSLKDLIGYHNKAYHQNYSLADEEHGACMIDTHCDDVMRHSYEVNGDKELVLDRYKDTSEDTVVRVNRVMNDYTELNAVCPTSAYLVYEYNNDYPDEYGSGLDAGDITFLVLVAVCILWWCQSK